MPFTSKGNTVAVVTDGSAVLGLGNLGPEAALPVMEGQGHAVQRICGNRRVADLPSTRRDPDEIVLHGSGHCPGFGAINLEDISSPRCFEIERTLESALDIPVMHDDQHGTAVVILAALTNALTVTGKRMEDIRVVVNGLGAAGTACCRMLLAAGLSHLVGCETRGIVLRGDGQQLRACRTDLAACMTKDRPQGTLRDALKGADVFIGLSVGNIVTAQDLDLMAADRIVFAMAQSRPRSPSRIALASHCRIFATGTLGLSESNQQRSRISRHLSGCTGRAGARHQRSDETGWRQRPWLRPFHPAALSDDYIIPSVFDKGVVPRVAKAVATAARETGVARRRTKLSDDFASRLTSQSNHVNPAVSTALLACDRAVLQCVL